MKLVVSFSQIISFLIILSIGSLLFSVPLFSEAQEQRGVVYVDPELNVVGIFPEESMAVQLVNTMNEGPLSDGVVQAGVALDEVTGQYKVYLETVQRLTNLSGGCMLYADSTVVRKGGEVTFSWETDQSILNCKPGEDEDCGLLSEVSLQEKGVEGNSITLPIEETEVYVLSAKVTDYVYYTEDGEEPEMILKPAICTVEVQVTNWFKWLLWKLFSVQP